MTTQYLLPCACGKKNEVGSNQAGLTITCSCGAEVSVPMLRNLKQLEQAQPRTAARKPGEWSLPHGIVSLGVVVFAISLAVGAVLWAKLPVTPEIIVDWESNRLDLDGKSYKEVIEVWYELRRGLRKGELPIMTAHAEQVDKHMELVWVDVGVGVVGIATIVAGVVMLKSRKRR